jgi:hypothetical protein
MTKISTNYKFKKFEKGNTYSGIADYRRFVTVDYNMESYVGLIGVGIINGWDMESMIGSRVQINPGEGFTNGYYIESPYTVKKRSEMVSGDREIEVIEDDDIPEPNLTQEERNTYVSIIKEYNPSFSPSDKIENAIVKVSVPYILDVPSHGNTYIYAKKRDSSLSPPALDYPNEITKPSVYNYENYDAYLVAMEEYETNKAEIDNYKWRDNPDNYFTIAEFYYSIEEQVNNDIFLGEVVARNGNIIEIKTDNVESVKNLGSQIQDYAERVLESHNHGGNKFTDPPKINLETDIRSTVLEAYSEEIGAAQFNILQSKFTTVSENHKHTYYIDSNGNGLTVETVGSHPHFHIIEEFEILPNQDSVIPLKEHIHEIEDSVNELSSTSQFNVYINGEYFANQNDTDKIDFSKIDENKIVLKDGISIGRREFETEFDYSYPSFRKENNTYEYSSNKYNFKNKTFGISHFMLTLSKTFDEDNLNKYSLFQSDDSFTDTIEGTVLQEFYNGHPFIFFEGSGNGEVATIKSQDELLNQCMVAEASIKEVGDSFMFVPDGAKNIKITLTKEEVKDSSVVTIEILGKTEVQGEVKSSNILYIHAGKISSGELEIERIPFLNHIGRTLEPFKPYKYSIQSNDGYVYNVLPSFTTFDLNHSHNLNIDYKLNGDTKNVYLDNKPIYYQDVNEETYLIDHKHTIANGVLSETASDGFEKWISNYIPEKEEIQSSNTSEDGLFDEETIKIQNSPLNGESIDDDIILNQNFQQDEEVQLGTNEPVTLGDEINFEEASGASVSTEETTNITNENSSTHKHEILKPYKSKNHIIYSIVEDSNENIFMGTSYGTFLKPKNDYFSFTINMTEIIQKFDTDLTTTFKNAISEYERIEEKEFNFNENSYDFQIEEAVEALKYHDDEYLIFNQNRDSSTDITIIKKLDYFKIPFYETRQFKSVKEIKDEEEVIDVVIYDYDNQQIIETSEDLGDITEELELDLIKNFMDGTYEVLYHTKFDLNSETVWDLNYNIKKGLSLDSVCVSNSFSEITTEEFDFNNITQTTCSSISFKTEPEINLNSYWVNAKLPVNGKGIKKTFYDSNENTWAISDNGLFVSRSNYGGSEYIYISNIGKAQGINDIVESKNGEIWIASENGLFYTKDQGASWIEKKIFVKRN